MSQEEKQFSNDLKLSSYLLSIQLHRYSINTSLALLYNSYKLAPSQGAGTDKITFKSLLAILWLSSKRVTSWHEMVQHVLTSRVRQRLS